MACPGQRCSGATHDAKCLLPLRRQKDLAFRLPKTYWRAAALCSDIPAFREVRAAYCRFVALGSGEEEALALAIRDTLQESTGELVSLPHLSAEVLATQSIRVTTLAGYQRVAEDPVPDSVLAHGYADLLGAKVGAIDLDMTVDKSDRFIAACNRGYICVTGVHGVMEPCIPKYSRWYAEVLGWSLSGAFADKPHMRPGLLGGYVPTFRQTWLLALSIRRPTGYGNF